MVARAWRPADGSGMRGARARGQQGRGTGPGQGEDDAWGSPQQEVARRRRQSGGQGEALPAAGEETEQGTCSGKKKRGKGVRGTCW
jgi:hypothetical protein